MCSSTVFFSWYVWKGLPVYHQDQIASEKLQMKVQRLWLFLCLASQYIQMIIGCLTVIEIWRPHHQRSHIRWNQEGGKSKFLFLDSWIIIEKISSNGQSYWTRDFKYSFALDVPCIQILITCDYNAFTYIFRKSEQNFDSEGSSGQWLMFLFTVTEQCLSGFYKGHNCIHLIFYFQVYGTCESWRWNTSWNTSSSIP